LFVIALWGKKNCVMEGFIHTILAQHLARHNLLIEEGLSLLHAGRESLLLGLVDLGLDGAAQSLCRGLGFLLLGADLLALVSSQVTTEFGVSSSLEIKVCGICFRKKPLVKTNHFSR
jgi:hypothetical protein